MKLTVWIITYNHEKYIAKAIESALMQKTTFDFELMIGEDCSTDKTREIVKAYKEKYPGKIRLFLPEKNLGMMPMTIASYKYCTGEYVASLNGDDYWTDPYKLQKQVEFLEANQDYSVCFHKVTRLNMDDYSRRESPADSYGGTDKTFVKEDLIERCYPSAVSVVYRNVLGKLPAWYGQLPWPDWGLFILLSGYGKFRYMNENMACYRVHAQGVYSGSTNYSIAYQSITFYKLLRNNISPAHHKAINRNIAGNYFNAFRCDYHDTRFWSSLYHLSCMFYYDPALVIKKFRSISVSIIRLCFKTPAQFFHRLTFP